MSGHDAISDDDGDDDDISDDDDNDGDDGGGDVWREGRNTETPGLVSGNDDISDDDEGDDEGDDDDDSDGDGDEDGDVSSRHENFPRIRGIPGFLFQIYRFWDQFLCYAHSIECLRHSLHIFLQN